MSDCRRTDLWISTRISVSKTCASSFRIEPKNRIGSDAVWDQLEAALKGALEGMGHTDYSYNPGEGALGRSSSLCCAMRLVAIGNAGPCR